MTFRRLLVLVVFAAFAALPACSPTHESEELDPWTTVEQGLTICPDGGTLQGLDVSHWDGTIDWAQVKNSGRVFAFMKATEGTGYVDPTFTTNWAGAQANGVYRSAYHFFHANMDGNTQADHFLATVGDQTGSLPPMLDMEVTDGQTAATIVTEATKWLTRVQAATGKAPMIYTSPSFWTTSVGSPANYNQFPLFVANWGVLCPNVPSRWTHWVVWQTSSTGVVPGISGSVVDLDTFNGDLAALAAYTVTPDGGVVVVPDAGPPPPSDGGLQHLDGGAPDAGISDGGAEVQDSGTPEAGDAGSLDGGHGGGTMQGACGCTSVDATSLSVLLGFAALLSAARRRRQ